MRDNTNDQLIPVLRLARERFGRRPAPSTIWRWCKKGVKGVRLTAVHCFGTWHCTAEDFEAFLAAQTAAAMESVTAPPQERDEATTRRLREAGLLR